MKKYNKNKLKNNKTSGQTLLRHMVYSVHSIDNITTTIINISNDNNKYINGNNDKHNSNNNNNNRAVTFSCGKY